MSIFYPDGKKLTIGGEEFAVKPFVLRTRTKVIRILAECVLGIAKDFPGLTKEKLFEDSALRTNMVVTMITIAGDRLIEVYELLLEKDREWLLDKIQLKDEIEMILAVWEVNDVPFLVEQVTSMARGLRKIQTPT